MIRHFLYGIMAVYAMLLFVMTLFPVYLILLFSKLTLNPVQYSRFAYSVFKVWMGFYLPLVFCPVTVKGKDRLKKNEKYIFILNHSSLMDIPVSTPYIFKPNKTLAKNDFLKIPIFGLIYSSCSITINRKDTKSRAKSFSLMNEAFEQGFQLALYPEGKRNKTENKLLPFQDGAFRIAIQVQAPIVITSIKGTKNILHPSKKLYFKPSPITLTYIEVVDTNGKTENDIANLKEYCFNKMQQNIS